MASITKIVLTWTNTAVVGVGLASDVLHGAIYNANREQWVSIPPLKTRADLTQEVDFPAEWDDSEDIHIYGAWRRADGLDCSETMYALAE
jgi:hypothetical protein